MDICKAISERRLISLTYDGYPRVVQPATHGKHATTGNEVLRAYQIKGTGVSGRIAPFWDMFSVSKIQNFKILDETFDSNPPDYRKGDSHINPIQCEL